MKNYIKFTKNQITVKHMQRKSDEYDRKRKKIIVIMASRY